MLKKNSGKETLKVNKSTQLWKVSAITSTALFLVSLGVTVYLVNRPSSKPVVGGTSSTYYDKYLNLSLNVPSGWYIAKMPSSVESNAVVTSTGGLTFDMGQFSLNKDIAPFTLYKPSYSGNYPYSKFMIFDFRGSDQTYSYLSNPVNLIDGFESDLRGLGETNIKVSKVTSISNSVLRGILLKGSASIKGHIFDYYRYFEPAGANILTITYGYVGTSNNTFISDISNALSSLVYYTGSSFTPSPFSSSSVLSGGGIQTTPNTTPSLGGQISAKILRSTGGIEVSNNPIKK